MKVAYLDGIRFYRVMYAGIQNLLDDQEYLNKINVFPVPDGDTGTNMAFTLMGIIEHIRSRGHLSLNKLSHEIADAALDNARGNSGVILAQFFQGLSEGLEPYKEVNTIQFASATKVAVDEAYTALMNPREGTILSVLRAWSNSLIESAERVADFEILFSTAKDRSQEALDRTPEQLKVLKDAGVVDAAGQGFLSMLQGISNFIETGNIRKLPAIKSDFSSNALQMTEQDMENMDFPFCTECIVVAPKIIREDLNKYLRVRGDSIVIAGSKTRAKIHIHTDDPGDLFSGLEQFGEVTQQKVDDMREQGKSIKAEEKVALVVDSTCDIPVEILDQHHIHVVPVRLNFGKEQFIDRVTISNDEFYKRLMESKEHPQTSQPPPADFSRMYQFLASHYESVISLHLPKVLSGTYQNAAKGLEGVKFKGNKVLLDSLSISAGTGITALEIADAIEADADFETIREIAERTIKNTKIFIGLKSLDSILKGGRLSLNKKRIIDLLQLNLVLSITEEGYLKPKGATFGRKNPYDKLLKFILKKVEDRPVKRIGIVHAMIPEIADSYKKVLEERFPGAFVFIAQICPALGVHGGIGAAGVAIQYGGEGE
ncbi:MAG: DegV family EDD domain-containing protein [Candidatus Marinimicrobia bacterium]|nr:DegV family EDD domain-containing protein [Candidatus Neomarinimicrobiota bacterium]MCF7851471.1 DegV family EDD domain-containing protein [Candidatus Neomarinimicrobiota bacterium]MCF7904730.1 DegV family EDD domain-containing protein [Candidatus Neomarinimicrobiota bacterium]